MIVDTGAACAINLSPHIVRRRGLWNAFPKFMETRAVGVTGGAAARLVKMPSVTFGPYRFHDVVVQLTDPEADDEDHDSDGLIGIDILRRFTLAIAANEAKLWLKPNDALGDAFRYNRAGMGVGFTDHKAVVANVTPGGPAAKAGLRIGDRLPEIKNRAFLDAFYWELGGAPGSQIDIQVDRPGGPQTLRLVLEDLL
jgi:membrane-associated protease RseP (regulator of RpoE activity)